MGRGQKRREEILVPGQHQRENESSDHARQSYRQNDGGKGAPDRQSVNQRRLFKLLGNACELIAHDPDDDWQNRERVEQDQADTGVEQRQRFVENQEWQRQHHRRQDQLAQEKE